MRLDVYLVNNGYFESRNKAKEAIERGEVYLDGKAELKTSKSVNEPCNIKVIQEKTFVSLGGYKLDKALCEFNLSVKDKVVVDIGASTGGFTDCLIQKGAKKVFAVDLNDDLLHERLKNDARVIRVIKNAKELTLNDFSDEIDFITADLSFISATSVMNVFSSIISDNGKMILLIKPQFEIGAKVRFKNGIVRDKKYREEACKAIYDCALSVGLKPLQITRAPNSEEKNVEFLILLSKSDCAPLPFCEISKIC